MSVVSVVLIFCLIGTLGAWRPDIDINRVRLVAKEANPKHSSRTGNLHTRRSIIHNNNNDFDDNRSGVSELRSPMRFLPHALPSAEPPTVKVYQPREDPKLYYLSDAYVKKVHQNQNLDDDFRSVIYPGRDVVHADSNLYIRRRRPVAARLKENEFNYIPQEYVRDDICTKCPHDLTLVAKAGSDRVQLPYPRIRPCAGMNVPRGVRYEHMHGQKFGSLLFEGSYTIVGKITFKRKILRHCVMEVRVLTQTCSLPKYLVAHCGDLNKTCKFACRDTKFVLHGSSNLSCGEDNRWKGNLPVCKDKNWCEMMSPPAHGRLSCKGTTIKSGLAEGSTCRVRCARDWKPESRPFSTCRFGSWTTELNCVSRNK